MTNDMQFYTILFIAFALAISAIGVIGIWVHIKKINSRRW